MFFVKDFCCYYLVTTSLPNILFTTILLTNRRTFFIVSLNLGVEYVKRCYIRFN